MRIISVSCLSSFLNMKKKLQEKCKASVVFYCCKIIIIIFLRYFCGLFLPLKENSVEMERERGNDMQQRTTGQIQTLVGCGKASAFIHGVPTLTTSQYRDPTKEVF